MKKRSLSLLVAAFAAALSSTQAATLYSTSFESPAFTAGTSVSGIDGWVAGSGSGASQAVSGTRASTGTQSLFFDNTGANTSFYSVIHNLGTFGTNIVTLTTDLYVPSTNALNRLDEVTLSTGTLGGTVLGLSIDGGGNIRMGKAWSTLYATAFQYTAAAGTFADRWLTATLSFNPATQTGTATLSGFGGTTTSYTSSFTAVGTPATVNLGTDYAGTTAVTGSTYYDNFAINTTVPEPGTVATLALSGAMGLWMVRRRRQA